MKAAISDLVASCQVVFQGNLSILTKNQFEVRRYIGQSGYFVHGLGG